MLLIPQDLHRWPNKVNAPVSRPLASLRCSPQPPCAKANLDYIWAGLVVDFDGVSLPVLKGRCKVKATPYATVVGVCCIAGAGLDSLPTPAPAS